MFWPLHGHITLYRFVITVPLVSGLDHQDCKYLFPSRKLFCGINTYGFNSSSVRVSITDVIHFSSVSLSVCVL